MVTMVAGLPFVQIMSTVTYEALAVKLMLQDILSVSLNWSSVGAFGIILHTGSESTQNINLK